MRQELDMLIKDEQTKIQNSQINEELEPIIAGHGQCLVRGCLCTGFKGVSICSTCGHSYEKHQD